MGESKKRGNAVVGEKNNSGITPIYEKYARNVERTFSDMAFYEYFLKLLATANNQFTFSNRKKKTIIDLEWVDQIENALEPLQTIIYNSRNVIKEDEIIVNVANAKKNTPDTVRHLAQHGQMVQDYSEEKNEVRPDRLMQKLREESIEIYENRLVFTTLEMAFNFTKIRHDAIFGAMGDEFGAKLKMESFMENEREFVNFEMFMHIKEKDDVLMTDSKNEDVFARISRLYRLLSVFMSTPFAEQLSKAPRVKGTIIKTNVLKKNPNYKAVVKLYEFLSHYDKIGYTIEIIEQSPDVGKKFERDIYNNIMMQYIILKNHLQDEEDRAIPALKAKKRVLKPKFIHQIIEELTENYDLPDIEIRKVLIEQLTREQLMLEDEEERERIIAETEKIRLEREEEKRKQEEAEELARQKEAEILAERRRQEEEALAAAIELARILQSNEDGRCKKLFSEELTYFAEHAQQKIDERTRQKELREAAIAKMDEEEAVLIKKQLSALDSIEVDRAYTRMNEKQRALLQKIQDEEIKHENQRLERQAEIVKKQRQLENEAKEELSVYIDHMYSFKASLTYRKQIREQEETARINAIKELKSKMRKRRNKS